MLQESVRTALYKSMASRGKSISFLSSHRSPISSFDIDYNDCVVYTGDSDDLKVNRTIQKGTSDIIVIITKKNPNLEKM